MTTETQHPATHLQGTIMLPLEDALEALGYLIKEFISVEGDRTLLDDAVERAVAYMKLNPDDHESWESFSRLCDTATAYRHSNKLRCFGGKDEVNLEWRFFTDSAAIGCGKVEWTYEFNNAGRAVKVSWDFGQFSNKPIVIRAITNEESPDGTLSE